MRILFSEGMFGHRRRARKMVKEAEYFRKRTEPYFYINREGFEELRHTIWRLYPKDAQEEVEIAERVAAGNLPAQSHWFLTSKKISATGEYHRFSLDFDWNQWGNKEETWSLNKLYFVENLAKAYLLSGDKKFASAFRRIWNHWWRTNPRPDHYKKVRPKEVFGRGTSWRSLCMSVRTWNLLWAYHYFMPAMTDEELQTLVESLQEHGEYLAWVNSEDYFPGNWQFIEACCLACLAVMFPEFPQSSEWLDLAGKRFLQHFKDDIFPDGAGSERNFGYHASLLDFVLRAVLLAKVNGLQPAFVTECMPLYEKMWDFIMYSVLPNGMCPLIKHTFPSNYRPILSMGALLLQRGDLRFVGEEEVPYAALWMFGVGSLAAYERLPKTHPVSTSIRFPDGGYVFVRDGWEKESQYLVFTNDGPLKEGHDHPDKMSIELWAYGQPLIRDAGQINYDVPKLWYDLTRAHNTAVLDGRDQFNRMGIPFSESPDIRGLTEFVEKGLCRYITSVSDGYQGFAVRHHRRVFHVKDEYWLVTDFLSGEEERWVSEVLYHFPGEIDINGNRVIETYGGVHLLLLSPMLGIGIYRYLGEMKTLEPDTSMGEVTTPYIALAQKANLPHKYVALLYPYAQDEPQVSVTVLLDEPDRFALGIDGHRQGVRDIYYESLPGEGEIVVEGMRASGHVTWVRTERGKVKEEFRIKI